MSIALAVGLFAQVTGSQADTNVLFAIDDKQLWRYDGSGEDLGTAWRDKDFDDSRWPEGKALIAYEGGATAEPIRTRLPPTFGASKYVVTYYFRTHFNFSGNDTAGVELSLRHVIDDGAVFYLNGTEVHRFLMAPGAEVFANTYASANNENRYQGPFRISAASLIPGNNVCAVEVHQCCPDSSDIVFGAELKATVPFAPSAEEPTLVGQPSDQLIDLGAAATNQVTATGTSLAYQWLFNGTALTDATNGVFVITNFQPHHAGGYSVAVANAAGAVTSRVARLELNIPKTHSFGATSVEANGSIALAFDGNPSVLFQRYFDLYPLEVSSDLREWTPLAMLVRTNASPSPLIYRDTDAKSSRERFYRTFTNHFVTPLPKPTGPYAAGSVTRLLTDPSRSNRYNIPTNSSFMITIWYPARHRAGELPAPHFEPQLARDASAWNSLGSASAVAVAPFFSRHSYASADLAVSPGPLPVVTMSPGFGEFRGNHTAKMEELASHGFIAVSIDHSDCNATVFPDGRLLRSGSSLSQPLTPYFTHNVRDVQFVLDELARMNQDDPIFKGTMDLDRVATMGMSFGGGVAGEAARIDPRVKAAVFFDAYFQAANSLLKLGLQKPLLYGYSTQAGGDLRLFNKATQDAVAYQITNTRHGDFSDAGTWVDRADNPGRRAGAAVIDCMLSFLKKHLNGEDDHLLDNPVAKYPEIVRFQKK